MEIINDLIYFIGVYVIGRHIIAPRLADFIVKNVENSNGRFKTFLEHYSQHDGDLAVNGNIVCNRDRCATL